jgi:Photosynthetic reaction centre cytochrome C subunit
MKRSALFLAIAACLACASLPIVGQDATPSNTQAPARQQRPPMPKPTNLQVLPKDISTTDLIKQMRGYSQALGVHCEFCHEVNQQTHHPDFAADTKPDKGIARTMIAMTQEINSKYLTQVNDPDATPADKTVTCGTCHRGNTMPSQFTPKPEEHDQPAGTMMMKKPQ